MDTQEDRKPHGREVASRAFAQGLGVILALVAFCMSGYLWYALSRRDPVIGDHVTARLATLETGLSDVRADNTRLAQGMLALENAERGTETAVNRLGNHLDLRRRRWAIAEAEQLLVIANHRLALDHEVSLATAALAAADRALFQANDARYLPVRREIASELLALGRVRHEDSEGLALRLSAMAGAVDHLPVGPDVVFHAQASTPPSHTAPRPGRATWARWLAEVRTDFSGLVRIQREASARPPLLPPSEAYFVRQNLTLTLNIAELALLQHQETVYRDNLERASAWLHQYYDTSSPAVRHMSQTLADMARHAPGLRLPDISASLDTLRRLRAADPGGALS